MLLEQINKHKAALLMMNDLAAAPRDNDKSLSLELLRWSLFAVGGGARNGPDQILNRIIKIAGLMLIPIGGTFCLNKICLFKNDKLTLG